MISLDKIQFLLNSSSRLKKTDDRSKRFLYNERSNSNKKSEDLLKKQEDILSQTKVNFKIFKNHIGQSSNSTKQNITNINIYNYNYNKSPEKTNDANLMKTTNFFNIDGHLNKLNEKNKSYNSISPEVFKGTSSNFQKGALSYLMQPTERNERMEDSSRSPLHSLPKEDKKKILEEVSLLA